MLRHIALIGLGITFVFLGLVAEAKQVETRVIVYQSTPNPPELANTEYFTPVIFIQGTDAIQEAYCKVKGTLELKDGKETEDFVRSHCELTSNPIGILPGWGFRDENAWISQFFYHQKDRRFILTNAAIISAKLYSSCPSGDPNSPCQAAHDIVSATSTCTLTLNLSDVSTLSRITTFTQIDEGKNPEIYTDRSTLKKAGEATFLFDENPNKVIQL